ncbi:MAG: hypothetical protein ACXACD_10535 [Candidatus Thorarchaeota archaeon]|jgi:hypothetical protein
MAYNTLSGTVVANKNVLIEDNNPEPNIVMGEFYGDGTNVTNVARVVANDVNDYVVTLGNQSQTLVGEPNLRFNGDRLYVNAPVTASMLCLTGLPNGVATPASFLALDGLNNVILTSSAGGSGGTIGPAEDGSYSDGLFTDFTDDTPIGTPIDRFNEILKALAPSPAPTLDDIGSSNSGVTAKLSFGSSQGITGYTNSNTDAGFSAVDINGTYSVTTSGNNLRRGVFNGATTIIGNLNDDVSADGTNYPADSFGNSEQGSLVLEVNGAEVHSIDLTDAATGTGVPGSGTGSDLNASGSGFTNFSQTGSATFPDGTVLDIFQHRTGRYSIDPTNQRNGWNYARVIHRIGGTDTQTNYVEWINDPDANALSATGGDLHTLSMTGDLRLSGVKYHTGGSATYNVTADNAYRDVYSTSNITFTATRVSVPAQSFPAIDWAGGENETKQLQLTASATINVTKILNSNISVGVNVPHPLKSGLSNAASDSIGGILLYNLANNSTTTSETFRREDYRIVSGNYAAQADVTSSGNAWDSSDSLASNTGLIYYNERMYYPTSTDLPYSGDFTSVTNGPLANLDYSALTGDRNFYRAFANTGSASETNFRLTFAGDTSTRIVAASTSLSATNIHVFVKLPTTTNSMETGWLDLGVASASDETQLNDGDGAYVGTPGSLTINATHEGTFVTQTVDQNENLVVRIEASSAWTGYLSSISIVWGNA